MTDQCAVTFVAEVEPERLAALRTVLATMAEDPAGNAVVPFGRLDGVHFGRLLVLEATPDLTGKGIPALLVMMDDVDGSADRHVRQLAEVEGLDQVLSACRGYPRAPNTAARLAFLQAGLQPSAATYINTVGRSLDQVRAEIGLRHALETMLDEHRAEWAALPARRIRELVRDRVGADPALAWALHPMPAQPLGWRARRLADLVAVPAAGVVLSPVIALGAPVYAALLRWHERTDKAPLLRPDHAHVAELAATEDRFAHNQFSAIGLLKAGRFRRWTTMGALFVLDWAMRHFFARGSLAKVDTIHFARWTFFDDKRRVLFASNYDGSLESYMDDFIDKVAWGLNLVFSNGQGYPETAWLLCRGAKDERAFKGYLRTRQVPTQVWYSAYPELTAVNIANNAAIRAGLSGHLDEAGATAWLARL